jgi:hypothetical protein
VLPIPLPGQSRRHFGHHASVLGEIGRGNHAMLVEPLDLFEIQPVAGEPGAASLFEQVAVLGRAVVDEAIEALHCLPVPPHDLRVARGTPDGIGHRDKSIGPTYASLIEFLAWLRHDGGNVAVGALAVAHIVHPLR